MSTLSSIAAPAHPLADLRTRFLAILPKVEAHGRFCFRKMRCHHRQEEAVAEMVALAWHWFLRMAQRGKDACAFPTVLAGFAARHVNRGRRLCGKERSTETLSSFSQQQHGFEVERLPLDASGSHNPLTEALHDNTQTPVPDQVAFRVDFPNWRRTRTKRDRRILDALMVGERPKTVARRLGLSPSRVAQLRRDFQEDWERYGDEGW
jgi:hypothetical protein